MSNAKDKKDAILKIRISKKRKLFYAKFAKKMEMSLTDLVEAGLAVVCKPPKEL